MSFQQVGQFFIAAALFALLGILVWKNYIAPKQEVASIPAAFDQRFSDFTARQFNRKGALDWTVSGSQLNHLTDDKGYRFNQVECLLESKENNAPPWRLSAPTGSADERLTSVELTGGVEGHRAASGNQGALVFGTRTMTIQPQEQKAASTDPTRLAEMNTDGQPRWTSNSSAFNLNYNNQVFQQSKVHDHFNRPVSVKVKSDTSQGAQP
jgi:lipopolysaccharide export system protein LptC